MANASFGGEHKVTKIHQLTFGDADYLVIWTWILMQVSHALIEIVVGKTNPTLNMVAKLEPYDEEVLLEEDLRKIKPTNTFSGWTRLSLQNFGLIIKTKKLFQKI